MTRDELLKLLYDAHNELYGNCYEELPARLRVAIAWLESEANSERHYERDNEPATVMWVLR
jgi:hypothetical protein